MIRIPVIRDFDWYSDPSNKSVDKNSIYEVAAPNKKNNLFIATKINTTYSGYAIYTTVNIKFTLMWKNLHQENTFSKPEQCGRNRGLPFSWHKVWFTKVFAFSGS